MSRLPTPGGDDGIWGSLLNDFMLSSHYGDGTLKGAAVQRALPPAIDGQTLVFNAATGRWESQTLSVLPSVLPSNDADIVHKNAAETITGAKDFTGGATVYGIGLTLTDDVRLADQRVPVNNSVTDAKVAAGANIAQAKIANLTTDLAAKISVSEKGAANGVASLDAGGKIPNSQIAPPPPPGATTSSLGTIQLSGDLAGTATSPSIAKLQGQNLALGAPANGQAIVYNAGAGQWAAGDIQPTGYVRGDGVAKVTVGITAPTSPAVGDVWINTT